jgi:hypothetical protein
MSAPVALVSRSTSPYFLRVVRVDRPVEQLAVELAQLLAVRAHNLKMGHRLSQTILLRYVPGVPARSCPCRALNGKEFASTRKRCDRRRTCSG